MNLDTLHDDKDYYSGKLGDLSRKLNYSAIAIVWIFSKTTENTFTLSGLLWWALLFCIFSLLVEVFQYLYGYIVYDRYYMYAEKKIKAKEMSEEFEWHPAWTWPMNMFFYGKTVTSLIGFIMLIIYVFNHK